VRSEVPTACGIANAWGSLCCVASRAAHDYIRTSTRSDRHLIDVCLLCLPSEHTCVLRQNTVPTGEVPLLSHCVDRLPRLICVPVQDVCSCYCMECSTANATPL
jgi:hypothetical protein